MPQAEPPAAPPRSGRFGRLVVALAAGVAGGLIAPLIYPAVARNARPAAKKALRAGMAAYDRGRVAAAELGEHASDLLAEARAEYEKTQQPAAATADSAQGSEIVKLRRGREAAGS